MTNKRAVGILLGIGNGLLFLILLEIGVRIYDKERPFLPPPAPAWISFSPTLHYQMRPGFTGEIYKAPVEINSFGFRGREFSIEKSDTFRIVCMGNSCTFGNEVKLSETYPYLLEKRLKQRLGDEVQVINAGIPGYSSYQGKILWEEKIAVLQPDIVVVSYGFNDRRTVPDIGWQDGAEFFRRNAKAQSRMEFFRRSYLCKWLLHILNLDEKIPKIEGYAVRVDKEQYEANMQEIAGEAKSAGAKVLFLGMPDRNNLRDFYQQADALMNFREFQSVRDRLETSQNIYSRMMRHRFNQRADSLQVDIARLAEWPDVMAFHGGLPVFTAAEFNAAMRAAAEKNGVEFIDLQDYLDDGDFVDFIHLNRYGAETAAGILEERIMALGIWH